MLIPEQEEFLRWLDQQPHGASLSQMEKHQVPSFNRHRLRSLKDDKLLILDYYHEDGELTAFYRLSDKGREALQQLDEQRRKEAEQERQRQFENKISVANVLVSLIAFTLGMLVEHFNGIVAWLFALFT